MTSQSDAILAHLKLHGHITPLEALDLYGCFRLAARVSEIRALGFAVETEMEPSPTGARYARYTLRREPVQVGMGL